MPADVEVRLWSPSTGIDRVVTGELIEGLEFAASGVGGYSTLGMNVARPVDQIARDLDPLTSVTVYDPSSAEILWDGYLSSPGRGTDEGGPVWDVQAEGARSHVKDDPRPLVYVDTRMSEWERVDDFGTAGLPNATVDTTGGSGESPGLRVAFPRGLDAPPGSTVTVRYPHLAASGQGVGRAQVTHFEGLSTGNANMDLVVRFAGLGGGIVTETQLWNSSPQQLDANRASIGSGLYRYVDFRARLTVGGVVNTDVTYSQASFMLVKGTRVDVTGTELATAPDYANNYVTCPQVIADLLGRMLPLFDGPAATVDTTAAAQIQQLAYETGTDAGQVLDDLMMQAPSHRWAAWERNAAGRHRFEWVPWDATPTILADTSDGFTSPGSAADLIDTVRVRWKNAQGKVSWATYTQDNPLLTAQGRHRAKVIDLGSEVGSAAGAAAAAAAELTAGLWPTNNGTLTVRKPVRDVVSGRMVHPRELPRYAGKLIRLTDVESWVDAINPSDRDGASVYRMANVSYDAQERAAQVTLDSYDNTVEAALIRIGKLAARVRRS